MVASSTAKSLFPRGGSGRLFTALALSVPVALFVKDTFYSFYRVEGSSMEPALCHGDVLLVRKADIYPLQMWQRWNAGIVDSGIENDGDGGERESEEDRENGLRVMVMDAQSNRPVGTARVGRTWLHPPAIYRSGEVVVFRAPDAESYPSSEYRVKRVWGLGGQRVRPADGFHRCEVVPPFGLWVEGDNHQGTATINNDTGVGGANDGDSTTADGSNCVPVTSIDSRTYGPISKNLVEGIAERVVWPPNRWGRVERISPPVPRAWWPFG